MFFGFYDDQFPKLTLGITIAIAVIFTIGYVSGYYYYKNNKCSTSSSSASSEPFADSSSPAKLTLYFAPWCGWSKKFLPAWEELKKQNLGVEYVTLNCDEDTNKQSCSAANGFPTVILTTASGKTVTYNGNRTVDDLVNFVKSNK